MGHHTTPLNHHHVPHQIVIDIYKIDTHMGATKSTKNAILYIYIYDTYICMIHIYIYVLYIYDTYIYINIFMYKYIKKYTYIDICTYTLIYTYNMYMYV